MSLSILSLALVADGESDPSAAIAYALALAESHAAALSAALVVPSVPTPALGYSGYAVATQMLMIVERENLARKEDAERTASRIRNEAARLGVAAEAHVLSALSEPTAAALQRLTRASDLCVVAAPMSPAQRDFALDLLFGAGVPALLVPSDAAAAPPRRVVVAWDGGRAAARAVRDAAPLLAQAETVEIVSVLGEKTVDGADLLRHLARRCRAVSARDLPETEIGAAAALVAHARAAHADLLVMGAYGHSRLREFWLGGATRDMLAGIALPTLMSH